MVSQGTRVITASEDDSAPVILVWDLRNYRTPERVRVKSELGRKLCSDFVYAGACRTREGCLIA